EGPAAGGQRGPARLDSGRGGRRLRPGGRGLRRRRRAGRTIPAPSGGDRRGLLPWPLGRRSRAGPGGSAGDGEVADLLRAATATRVVGGAGNGAGGRVVMPSTDCARIRPALGAYVLGGLEPVEAADVRTHLATCAECRAAYDEIAPLPRLLSMVSAAQAEAGLG